MGSSRWASTLGFTGCWMIVNVGNITAINSHLPVVTGNLEQEQDVATEIQTMVQEAERLSREGGAGHPRPVVWMGDMNVTLPACAEVTGRLSGQTNSHATSLPLAG